MSIQDIKDAKVMRECFEKIGGRKGVSERAIAICKAVGDNPRAAIYAVGRLARLYQVAQADDYWGEKSMHGRQLEWYAVQQASYNGGDFSKAIDAVQDSDR